MRYICALSRSTTHRRINFLLSILMLLPSILALSIIWTFSRGYDLDPGIRWMMIVILIVTLLGFVVYLYLGRRLLATQVEITDKGVHHLSPGSEMMIDWIDVKEVIEIRGRKSPATVRLITDGLKYSFDPYLVPDAKDAPKVVLALRGPKWRLNDGSVVPATLENSSGYKLIVRYRPDLLPTLQK